MSNLSYCRFENTLKDLMDCLEALKDGALDEPDMSETERESALELIEISGEIFDKFSYEAENNNDEDGSSWDDEDKDE